MDAILAQDTPPSSFQTVLEELVSLMDEPGVPGNCIYGALGVFQALHKCLLVNIRNYSVTGSVLQPTDIFLRYVAAFRAGDWPLVSSIEREICS